MNKRHYEHTLPNIRGSLSNTYNPHCPQGIDIPKELQRIDRFVEQLKQETL